MSLSDIFSNEADRALRYGQDLFTVILSPRTFAQRVAGESTSETIRRLMIYVFGFALLEVAIMKTAVPRSAQVDFYEIVGVAVFETAFSFLFFPVFLAITFFARIEKPLKTALVYSVTLRLLFLIPALIGYGLFLLTEDYLFALIKGVLVYAYILVYVVILPISLPKSLKQRGLALLIAFLVASTIVFLFGLLASKTTTSTSSFYEYSILYDPIGAEVDELDLQWQDSGDQNPLHQLVNELGDISQGAVDEVKSKLTIDALKKGATVESLTREVLKARSQTPAVQQWSETKTQLMTRWNTERTRLEAKRQAAKFNTTRKFIDLRLREIQRAEETANAVDIYLNSPSLEHIKDVYNDYTQIQDAILEGQGNYIETLSMENWLLRLHLIV